MTDATLDLRRERLKSKLRSFGFAAEDDLVDFMQECQTDTCWICDQANGGRVLCLDHDHETNFPRGFLCDRCNRALGGFRDDPDVLLRAYRYLIESQLVIRVFNPEGTS